MERWPSMVEDGEMAEYGRRRSPAKRVYWETGIEGSNPSLSVNTKGQ